MLHAPPVVGLTPGLSHDAQYAFHGQLCHHMPVRCAVLDLGCGDHAELARYRTPERELWGTDLREHPELRHRDWFRRLPPDGQLPFADGYFELVAAAWVLEHVAEPAAFFAEVSRVLRPGGHFIAVTPHAWHYVTWLIRAVGLLPHRVTQRIVASLYRRAGHNTFPTYYRLNSRDRIAAAARGAGLELKELTAFANPDYFRFAGPALSVARLADQFLERLRFGLGRLYLVAVLQKPTAIRAVP